MSTYYMPGSILDTRITETYNTDFLPSGISLPHNNKGPLEQIQKLENVYRLWNCSTNRELTILQLESSTFQRKYENGQLPRSCEIQHGNATNRTREAPSWHHLTAACLNIQTFMSLLINTPDSWLQISPFILSDTVQLQNQEELRNINSLFQKWDSEAKRHAQSPAPSKTARTK